MKPTAILGPSTLFQILDVQSVCFPILWHLSAPSCLWSTFWSSTLLLTLIWPLPCLALSLPQIFLGSIIDSQSMCSKSYPVIVACTTWQCVDMGWMGIRGNEMGEDCHWFFSFIFLLLSWLFFTPFLLRKQNHGEVHFKDNHFMRKSMPGCIMTCVLVFVFLSTSCIMGTVSGPLLATEKELVL